MAGLFDYQSPENMRAARLQPLLVSGAQMGQQPLLSQLVSQMSNAGANLGAGLGMAGLFSSAGNAFKNYQQPVAPAATTPQKPAGYMQGYGYGMGF